MSGFRVAVTAVDDGFADVCKRTALEQAALIRSRAISSEELVRATLRRIAANNAALQAFVVIDEKGAIAVARQKDQALRRGDVVPTFHGVPTGVKDLNFVRGMRTRMGSRGSVFFFPSPFDDKSAASIRRGGFVIVGKTATSELGAMPVTETAVHPPTRNPWNLDHSPGGSSGGAAAAVAAGLLPIAHGSDGGGSVRLPSSFCGLFGFKPSRGRVANAFGLPDRQVLYTCGPLAHSVADAAAFTDVLAGLDGGAPHWATPPPMPYAQMTAPSRRLRIKFTTHAALGTTDVEVKAAVVAAAAVFSDLGHDVSEGAFPGGALDEVLPLWQHLLAHVPLIRMSKTQPITRWLIEAGKKLEPAKVAAQQELLSRRFLAAFDDVDVWLSPTTPATAPRVGAFLHNDPAEAFTAAAAIGAFTIALNITGQPGASVPLGLSSAGLPMGLQIAAKPFADDVVFALAREFETARPWR